MGKFLFDLSFGIHIAWLFWIHRDFIYKDLSGFVLRCKLLSNYFIVFNLCSRLKNICVVFKVESV